ncbi:Golgi SNAP receptor complex member 1-like [Rhopilema esculentum]|uniref:Golgi SNAP receptor complex member 1-like n=1 Tax=Rhopilema esculentum TaxID=499914 RepID=UPI0031CFEEF4
MANGLSPNKWEELRKEARQLENELEMKLVSFSKLGTGQLRDFSREGTDREPLLGSNGDHMFETMSMEIERLLSKLTKISDEMGDYFSQRGFAEPSAAQLHTMQRHRDILQDYLHEFTKTKASIKANRDREDLLGSVKRDMNAYKNGLNRRTDLYLKEHEHLRNSDRLADEAIGIAMATKENISSQRNVLHNISKGLGNVSNRFPAINNLIQKVNIRKRRDTIIVGTVISICTIVLLVYAFR